MINRPKKECNPIVDRKYAYLTHKHSWWLSGKGYAVTQIDYQNVLMHRLIMELELGRKLLKKEIVDHRDFNTLNNQIYNLRVVTKLQNCQHRKRNRFRGTSRKGNSWQAEVCFNQKSIYLGVYSSRKYAAKIARNKRKELNFLGANND